MIYHTDDIEGAIRKMVELNERCVVFQRPQTLRPIRLRLNCVADIPSIACRTWDAFAQDSVDRWKSEGGLLYYRPDVFAPDIMPETDALLFAECPLQYRILEQYSDRVKRDIIIFKPPSWVQHEATIEFKYPRSDYYQTLELVIRGLIGREVPDKLAACLRYSGYPADKTAVFLGYEVAGIMGISERQLRILLKWHGFRGNHIRYHCFTPMVPPEDDPDAWEIYSVLEEEPNVYRGMRALRFFELARVYQPGGLANRIPGFKPVLKRLVKSRHVADNGLVYVVKDGWRKPDYAMMDATANVRRGDWYKLRNLVDQSENYFHQA